MRLASHKTKKRRVPDKLSSILKAKSLGNLIHMESTLVKRQSNRRWLAKYKLEREFSKLTKDMILSVYIANYDDRATFKKILGTMLVGKGRMTRAMHKNIDLLYDEFVSRYGSPVPNKTNTTTPLTDDMKLTANLGDKNQAGGQAPMYEDGPYLQRLTSKGDKPITGNDVSKALEEISTILNDLQYLQEDGGPVIRGFNVLLNYFNGDPYPMKSFIRYYFAPKFYSTFPPSINIGAIGKRLDNIIDFLNIYKNDKRIRSEYAVEQGRTPQTVLKLGFFDKLTEKLDTLDQNYNKFKQYRRFQFN